MNLLEKQNEIRKKKKIQEYEQNEHCNVISILNIESIENYHKFLEKNISYLSDRKYECCFSLNNNNIDERISWIVSEIKKVTYDNDIIIIPFLDFGIECKITDVHSFFEKELHKMKVNFVGLDIGYINKTKNKNHYFSDEEYFIYEFLQPV